MANTALYDPGADSPFFTGSAVRLCSDDTVRDAYARVAERLLGLYAPAFTGDDAERAKDAVAMQVNHLLAAGTMVYIAKAESRGQRAVSYRDNAQVNPVAKELADQVNIDNGRDPGGFDPAKWRTVISLRGYQSGPGYGWMPAVKDFPIRPEQAAPPTY